MIHGTNKLGRNGEGPEDLQPSETRYRQLFESAQDGILILDAITRKITDANPFMVELLGYSRDEFLGKELWEIGLLKDEKASKAAFQELMEQGYIRYDDMPLETKNGRRRDLEFVSNVYQESDRKVVQCNIRDITERKSAEKTLCSTEERYRSLFESNPLPMWVTDLERLTFLAVNDAAVLHYGYSREEFLSMTVSDIRRSDAVLPLLDNVFPVSGIRKVSIWSHQKKDGSVINVEVTSHELIFAGRRAALVLVNDVTERRRGEDMQVRRTAQLALRADVNAALAESGAPLLRTLERCTEATVQHLGAACAGIWTLNQAENVLELQASSGIHAHIGGSHARVPLGAFEIGIIAKDRQPHITNDLQSDPRINDIAWALREGIIGFAGYPLSVEDRLVGVIAIYACQQLAADTVDALASIADTISQYIQRKRAEKALGLSEAQLRQSQKLEAIGQLAGGVAHDFNNLLTVIFGYSDLSLNRLQTNDPLWQNLQEIRKAADRAASLTRQLLAFSRKQVLQPKVLDLNTVVSDLEKMLRRLIGEDIELRTTLATDLGNVKADPGQIEQVIMNLAINSRDAMPQGGKLTIETQNVNLEGEFARQHMALNGPYVMLAVSDTGTGISEETQKRIFDPFFTTKGLGKGTGLGLSTVYGIVKQSGGYIWVYSELGQGTTFKIFLARIDEEAREHKQGVESGASIQGTETILLAEDEELVRKLTTKVLETQGYQVLEAANGSAALLIFERHRGSIDLVITDVIMPEMSGRELVDRLAQLCPEMKVLYMSGYTADAIVHHGMLDAETAFIQKPFSPNALAHKVREVLDEVRRN